MELKVKPKPATPTLSAAMRETSRLSVDLPKDVKRDLKTRAASEGRTVSEIVTELVVGYVDVKK